MMDSAGSGHLYFDASCHGNMLLLGTGDPVLRGCSRSYLNIDQESSKRTPFFTSSDDLMDEEYYDEQMPEKKRRLTPEQVHLLEKSFEAENKLEPERKTQLAKKLGLQPRQVAVWFQNRRARWKTKQLERDYDNLKSSYDSLRSDHDSLLKDNEKLKSEVVTLTEKLQAKEVAPMVGLVQKSEPLLSSENEAAITPVQLNIKVEDRLSSGSGGSAVVDEDGLQLVDSGDSYFPNDDTYRHCEDDGGGGGGGSEDSRSCYFADVFATVAEHNQQEEAEPLGWWVWS